MRHFIGVVSAVMLIGCSNEPFTLNSGLTDSTNPIFDNSAGERIASIIETRQGAPYNQIVLANFTKDEFLISFTAQQQQLNRDRDAQIWLPRIRPSAQIGANGQPLAGINVEQFIYDGGIYNATTFQTDAQAKLDQIELLQEINTQISTDIQTYLEIHQNLMKVRKFEGLIKRIDRLLATAETRASGGISSGNEVTLFELKRVEAESEIAIAQSTARLKATALSNALNFNALATPPSSILIVRDRLPFDVLNALATYEVNRSAVEVARANATPKVTLAGDVQYDFTTGSPTSNAGLRIGSDQAIPLNGYSPFNAAMQELQLSEFRLQRASQDIQLQVQELTGEIALLRRQSLQVGSLVRIAENRLNQFDDQFLAGSSNITEAAGLIDTLKRSLESQIESEFRILDLERQLAEITGSYID